MEEASVLCILYAGSFVRLKAKQKKAGKFLLIWLNVNFHSVLSHQLLTILLLYPQLISSFSYLHQTLGLARALKKRRSIVLTSWARYCCCVLMTLCFDQGRKRDPFEPTTANSALTKKEGSTTSALVGSMWKISPVHDVPVVPALLLQGGCGG